MEENLIDARIDLSSLHWIRVLNREGQAGPSMQSSKNRTKVCGWMGYMVGDLRTQVRVMEKCGSEFQCGVTWSVTTGESQRDLMSKRIILGQYLN